MGVIQEHWCNELGRVEEGIFFGNDEYIALDGRPDTGYTVAERRPVSDLVDPEPDAWCNLDATVRVRDEGRQVSVHAGETSWEGEGFVAVVSDATGELLWLLHLSTSEPFAGIRVDGDVIRARSGNCPDSYDWCIPIAAPESFTVSRGS